MNTGRPAPPLPEPPHPAVAAHAVARAAQAAARAWAQPLTPSAHRRAVSQLHSVLRDLGIAARGLAAWQAGAALPVPAASDFPQHAGGGSRWLLNAWERLDGVLAAEGISPSGDPDDPGTDLCQAARDAILAWRQPAGPAADRDATVRLVITATGFLSAAILGLATCAPRRLVIDLQAAGASLAEATACLTAAVQQPDAPAPPHQDEDGSA